MGIKVAKEDPPINHLLFADDCLLFFQADEKSISSVLDILHNFGAISGQMINFSKSAASITGDLSHQKKMEIINNLGVKKLCKYDKYLGLPILLGKSKTTSFESIKDAFNNRLSGWNSKLLNQPARTTMVRSVLNSIPSHYMSNFRLPKHTLQQLDPIQRRLWWGNKANKGINIIA
ncbi:uncharacterized protein LOC113296559 [Papaver somniferum]|uniref:uncharacterized protein LOC113296559 n=1 Tax=Papaver somniferum TaxID=3469 RepID=UPI000E6F9ABA|nr:uncharacterized protein LOC113296559 [Papaver somniferum]